MSEADFAALTGMPESQVCEAVNLGSLLKVQRTNPDGSIESGIAAFQGLKEIAGEPLSRISSMLGYGADESITAADVYMFLTGRHELLADLTPIEVLTGSSSRESEVSEVLECFQVPTRTALIL